MSDVSTDAVDRVHSAEYLRYIGPFACFLLLLVVGPRLPLSPVVETPLRCLVLGVVCVLCWPRSLSLTLRSPLWSVALGLLVFALWVAPDVLWHGYRQSPLFSNGLVGSVHSSIPPAALRSSSVLFWRTVRAALIVPVVEELFWRGWLMRWLIDPEFERVRLGAFTAFSFGVTALLFASEHGPYWDVGLMAGLLYNGWMVKTRSIADCVLAHGVTNAALSGYVIWTAQWQYWQ